ncbi:glucose-1-phosphate cytidylyltransferase [Candidatus Kaiserbacteria bacterium]|nr:glucose-1-phosphate cytidylyltransferase [Candidatus Kaiserbacteria bacterium]
MPVVIFCGGRGTRLKEETEVIPKPMVSVGGKPILWHIMKIYHAQGFRKFILLLGYKGDKIKEYVRNYPLYANDFTLKHKRKGSTLEQKGVAEDWEITCLDTGLDTQTGGRLKKAKALVKAPFFMLTYGDGVGNIDLSALLDFHKKKGRIATMTAVHPPVRFGEVVFENGDVRAFREKPDPIAHRTEHLINGGYFVIDSRIFRRMPDKQDLVFEKDVLTKLADDGELAALPHRGYWQCMDTIRDTEVLNEAWKSGKAPWKVWK